MRVRTIRAWSSIHTWSSIVCTAFLLLLCVTGLPLIFHDEIDELLQNNVAAADAPPGTPAAARDLHGYGLLGYGLLLGYGRRRHDHGHQDRTG